MFNKMDEIKLFVWFIEQIISKKSVPSMPFCPCRDEARTARSYDALTFP